MDTHEKGFFDSDDLRYVDTSEGLDIIHAFTWSPNPKYFKSTSPVDQFIQIIADVFKHRQLGRTFAKYYFVPELNTHGNIHIHGYYTVLHKYSYNTWFLPVCKKLGFVKIKKYGVNEEWVRYCRKDLELMKEILYEDEYGQRLPVPMTPYTLLLYKVPKDIKYASKPIKTYNIKLKARIRRAARITDYI